MNCQHCENFLASTAKFCGKCGAAVQQDTPTSATPTPVDFVATETFACPDCAADCKPGARFCPKCGHRFDSAPAASAAVGFPSEPAPEFGAESTAVAALSESREASLRPLWDSAPASEPGLSHGINIPLEKEGGSKKAWLVVLLIAVLAAAGAGGWIYSQQKSSDSTDAMSNEQVETITEVVESAEPEDSAADAAALSPQEELVTDSAHSSVPQDAAGDAVRDAAVPSAVVVTPHAAAVDAAVVQAEQERAAREKRELERAQRAKAEAQVRAEQARRDRETLQRSNKTLDDLLK